MGTKTAALVAIQYHLPEFVLTNSQLSVEFPEWPVDKIYSKTGIEVRHIAAEDETAGDLGIAACKKLFASGACSPEDIDFLIFCTQSPDYFLPTTACVMQEALGLRTSVGALDINLGCSGFVYGAGLAKALIETGQASSVLLVTADTYSKFIHPGDKSVRSIFGDGAAAALFRDVSRQEPGIRGLVYGSDGRGADNLIVATGASRRRRNQETARVRSDRSGNLRSDDNLYMNGQEIFTFTLRSVPLLMQQVREKAGLQEEEIAHYVLHQANSFMLEAIRKKSGIAPEKFWVKVRDFGNTVSSTIPIALKTLADQGEIAAGQKVLIAGFGVGYSWAGAVLNWDADFL